MNKKGADQTANPRSLISAFVVRCLDIPLYNTSICYIRNFKPLASLCSWSGWFESYQVRNPEDRFSPWRDSKVMVLKELLLWGWVNGVKPGMWVTCLFVWSFKSSQHVECSQFTYSQSSWAGPPLLSSKPVLSAHIFASNWQLPVLNQRKGENGCRKISTKVMWPGWGSNSHPWTAVRHAANYASEPSKWE